MAEACLCYISYVLYVTTSTKSLVLGKPETAIVNQIFTEAKRIVYNLFVDGFQRILLEL